MFSWREGGSLCLSTFSEEACLASLRGVAVTVSPWPCLCVGCRRADFEHAFGMVGWASQAVATAACPKVLSRLRLCGFTEPNRDPVWCWVFNVCCVWKQTS